MCIEIYSKISHKCYFLPFQSLTTLALPYKGVSGINRKTCAQCTLVNVYNFFSNTFISDYFLTFTTTAPTHIEYNIRHSHIFTRGSIFINIASHVFCRLYTSDVRVYVNGCEKSLLFATYINSTKNIVM